MEFKAHGNYQSAGTYYPCVITDLGKTFVKVCYDEDGIVEHLGYAELMFK